MVKKILKFAGMGVSIALIMLLFAKNGSFMGIQRSLQNKFYDFASASPEIVIVTIDEKSLSEKGLGAWQKWRREYYAKAIDNLTANGAAVIGIDVTFPNQSIYGVTDDEILRDSIKKNKNVVLAGRYYFENGKQIPELPNPTLMEADPAIGWLNVKLDEDGFVRELPVFTKTSDGDFEAFSLDAARAYLKADKPDFNVTGGSLKFADGTSIPVIKQTDGNGEPVYLMYINYFAEPGSYTQISMSDLVKGNIVDKKGNKVDLKDKIVLIGPTAADLQDYYLSPVSRGVKMPGVEIHANNIQTIISGKFLRDQSALSLWLTILGLIIVNILAFSKLKIRFSIPILFAEILGIIIAGIIAYDQRVFLNVIYPLITVALTFVGTFLLRFLMEQSERKFVEGAFGHYVNKAVVEEIIKDPKKLELGGEKRDITAFFSDIQGFTSISEKMEPGQLVNFLNRYLTAMTDIILDNQGTLDKYEGDAIMAFWGAPLPLTSHAKNACIAALQNQKKLAVFREECEKQGLPALHVRIGINSGEAIAGNMGSKDRFNYTIMGDNVNLASRLEGINKQYGTDIIISESTYAQIKDDFVCRELDMIRVKGKENPVRIYELISDKTNVTSETEKKIRIFSSALELYRGKKFSQALEIFSGISDDQPSKILADRCAEFIKNPPAEGWGGVNNFTTK